MNQARNVFDYSAINLDDVACELRDYKDNAEVFRWLAAYLELKGEARSLRLSGAIDQAMLREDECERIYKDLPVWARW